MDVSKFPVELKMPQLNLLFFSLFFFLFKCVRYFGIAWLFFFFLFL